MATQNVLAAGVIGLGSMGIGMAQSMVKRGMGVAGYDINPASVAKLVEAGGTGGLNVAEAVKGADVLLVVVVNAGQTDAVLFGENGAAAAMKQGGVIVSSATMPQMMCASSLPRPKPLACCTSTRQSAGARPKLPLAN